MAARKFKVSLAFHWQIPDTLLYNFSQWKEDGKIWEPITINGCSLSNGNFFIEKFARSDDCFIFQLYEWMHEEKESPLDCHCPPKAFQFSATNFEVEDLFTTNPRFDEECFLPTPKPQSEENEPSPFPGLPHLYYWLNEPAACRHLYIRHLQVDQVFRIRAKVVVPSRGEIIPRITRTFVFDPEMTVGDDGSGPGDQDPDEMPSKGSKKSSKS